MLFIYRRHLCKGSILAFKHKYSASVASSSGTETVTDDDRVSKARTFAELTHHIEASAENGTFQLKLSNLHELYAARLHNPHVDKSVNKTRLKNHIVEYFHDNIQGQTDGRNTVLVFNKGMEIILKDALKEHDYEAETFALVRTTRIIRSDVFDTPVFRFAGEFSADC